MNRCVRVAWSVMLIVVLPIRSLSAQSDPPKEPKGKGATPKPTESQKADAAKKANQLTMTVTTKTGGQNKFAKADKLKVFLLINADETLRKPLVNRKKNLFELGATDVFENIPLDIDIERIESIRLLVEGEDLWKCDSLQIQFFKNGQQSKLYKFNPDRYFSAAKERKAFAVTKQMDFKFKPAPVLASPEETTKGKESETSKKK